MQHGMTLKLCNSSLTLFLLSQSWPDLPVRMSSRSVAWREGSRVTAPDVGISFGGIYLRAMKGVVCHQANKPQRTVAAGTAHAARRRGSI